MEGGGGKGPGALGAPLLCRRWLVWLFAGVRRCACLFLRVFIVKNQDEAPVVDNFVSLCNCD